MTIGSSGLMGSTGGSIGSTGPGVGTGVVTVPPIPVPGGVTPGSPPVNPVVLLPPLLDCDGGAGVLDALGTWPANRGPAWVRIFATLLAR